MLVLDTDMTPGTDFDRLLIEVQVNGQTVNGSGYVSKEIGFAGGLQFPITYAINGRATPTEVQLRVSTGRANKGFSTPVGEPVTLNEIVTTIPTDRFVSLYVPLQWLCIGYADAQDTYVHGTCPDPGSCIAGECRPTDIDSSSLQPFDASTAYGGGSTSGEGACFDVLGCFAAGSTTKPDANCTVEAPIGGAGVNVALIVPPGAGGICAPDACLIPLSAESDSGWRNQVGRIQLPPAVCRDVLGKRGTGVAVTTSCPPRTEGTPTCGPWSIVKRAASRDAGLPESFATDGSTLARDGSRD
jgi:hypothetical protein